MEVLIWAQVIALAIQTLMQLIRFFIDLAFELKDRQQN
jgi:hypothetical protein